MTSKGTVAVFFGGNSNEREISVITGVYCCNLLRGAGYPIVPVFLPETGGMATGEIRKVADAEKKLRPVRLEGKRLVSLKGRRAFPFDVALNCCHGGAGEDGTLAALLSWNNVKSASPGLLPSAVFMDKWASKLIAKGLGIPTVRGIKVRDGVEFCGEEVHFPAIVKPSRLGSSIGVKIARNEEELQKALALAFRLDSSAVVEDYLPEKRDLNCAAVRKMGEVVLSPVEEVFSEGDILSFSEKYEKSSRRSELPAKIGDEAAEKVRAYTRTLYEALDCRGAVRADFLLADGEIFFNEMNAVPGSLASYLFGDTLTEAKRFLSALVEEGMREEKARETVTTGILRRGPLAGNKSKRRF